MNVILFENRGFADYQVKKRLLRWPLVNITGVLIKRENSETDMHTRRMPFEQEGRDQGDVSIGHGCQRLN